MTREKYLDMIMQRNALFIANNLSNNTIYVSNKKQNEVDQLHRSHNIWASQDRADSKVYTLEEYEVM